MSANPHPGASHSEAMPTMDPRAIPFPPQLAQQPMEHAAAYGYSGDTALMGVPLDHAAHGPVITPVTEPAYAAPDAAEYYASAPLGPAPAVSMSAPTESVVALRRARITIGATAAVVLVAAIAFAIAWQIASGNDDAVPARSTSSEQTDAPRDDSYEESPRGGGFGPSMDSRGIGTPPEGAAGPGAAAGGPGAAGSAGAARAGGGAASAAPASRSAMANPGPGTPMPGMGPMSVPGASGAGVNPPSNAAGYRGAPAVQPVSGAAPSTPRPAAAAPRPTGGPGAQPQPSAAGNANGMNAMPGMEAGAGAAGARTGTPTANPVTTGNIIQPGPGGGATAAVPQAQGASATQVIIAVKTTANTWQLYKTDPRRVALQSNPAGANLQGAMTGVVWLAGSWQPAYILAQPTGPGVTGGGGSTTGGGAPMKR